MPDPQRPTFAETFESLRVGRGWSPAEVARLLDVYPTEVSRWRRGRGGISIRNVRKVADLFGVDRAWLERIAGYGDSNDGDTLDTVYESEAERQIWRARFDSLMETRVPRRAWKAYLEACDALADAYNRMWPDSELNNGSKGTFSQDGDKKDEGDSTGNNGPLATAYRRPTPTYRSNSLSPLPAATA